MRDDIDAAVVPGAKGYIILLADHISHMPHGLEGGGGGGTFVEDRAAAPSTIIAKC